MKTCEYCGKRLPKNKRKYCDATCSKRFKTEGPAREQFVYHEVDEVDVSIVNDGCWMLFPASQDDDQCIGDFMRSLKRAPKHVIFDPQTPLWKFAGPVWTDEELKWRWKGYEPK